MSFRINYTDYNNIPLIINSKFDIISFTKESNNDISKDWLKIEINEGNFTENPKEAVFINIKESVVKDPKTPSIRTTKEANIVLDIEGNYEIKEYTKKENFKTNFYRLYPEDKEKSIIYSNDEEGVRRIFENKYENNYETIYNEIEQDVINLLNKFQDKDIGYKPLYCIKTEKNENKEVIKREEYVFDETSRVKGVIMTGDKTKTVDMGICNNLREFIEKIIKETEVTSVYDELKDIKSGQEQINETKDSKNINIKRDIR